jgi:hypothetical protein
MLRVTIELIQQGNEQAKRTLRTMTISRAGETIDPDYVVDIGRAQGTVRGHHHRAGPWALVYRAIRALNLDLEPR